MTTGKISLRRNARLLLRLGLGLALWLPLAAAAEWDLPQLMELLRGQSSSRSEFVETKQLALLQNTLESRGTLEFKAPDYLRRRQVSPRIEEFEVKGDALTVRRGDQPPQHVNLQDAPPLAAFLDSIRATLAGDLATLQRHYRTGLSGSAAQWRLQLHPRPGPLASHVEYITLEGRQGQLRRIEIREVSGDRALTQITPLRP